MFKYVMTILSYMRSILNCTDNHRHQPNIDINGYSANCSSCAKFMLISNNYNNIKKSLSMPFICDHPIFKVDKYNKSSHMIIMVFCFIHQIYI